jgi:hypothetical protein
LGIIWLALMILMQATQSSQSRREELKTQAYTQLFAKLDAADAPKEPKPVKPATK